MRPVNLQVINDTLAIAWDDGRESYLALEALRRACPCAGCKGETNVMVEYKPKPQHYTPASFTVARWEFVGGYGIQPHWGDGHATGIYSFEYLLKLENQS